MKPCPKLEPPKSPSNKDVVPAYVDTVYSYNECADKVDELQQAFLDWRAAVKKAIEKSKERNSWWPW